MKEITLVFVGGGLGSVVRFVLGKWIHGLHTFTLPLGTLVANIAACLILGLVIGVADHKQFISPSARLFWTVGFCGGFSTFSTFSSETLSLMQGGFTASMLLYVFLSLVLCIAATAGGIYFGEQI